MKKNVLMRVFFGLMVVGLGGLLLLQNLGIINGNVWGMYWGTFWGAAFILSGAVALWNRGAWFWGTVLLAVGASIILGAFGVVDAGFWKIFWPLVLILLGVSLVFRGSFGARQTKSSGASGAEKIAIFYGEQSRPKGNYTGGSLAAVFGGIDLDLRQADVKDGSIIEVFALCGSVTIMLPDNVIVKNEVRGILGGSEDKTMPKTSAKKTLVVRGDCVLGGLELK